MTKQEMIDFINGMVTEDVSMVKLDKVKWEEFKTSVTALLNDPTIDPKYKIALESINTIITAILP